MTVVSERYEITSLNFEFTVWSSAEVVTSTTPKEGGPGVAPFRGKSPVLRQPVRNIDPASD